MFQKLPEAEKKNLQKLQKLALLMILYNNFRERANRTRLERSNW